MNEEGVIKFNCNWIKSEPLEMELLKEINACRNELFKKGLIGVTIDGIGFGNISTRFEKNTFIITGSGTGKISGFTNEHYTLVSDYDIVANTLTAIGPVIASSESLTHAMIYELQPEINAVIHVHDFKLWKWLLEILPSTKEDVEYGTPAMANEIKRLFAESNLTNNKIFAMAGHEEGVVCFGKDFEKAMQVLMKRINELQ